MPNEMKINKDLIVSDTTTSLKDVADFISNKIEIKELASTTGSGENITIDLTDSYKNYDFLLVQWSPYSLYGNIDFYIIDTATILSTQYGNYPYETGHLQTTSVWSNVVFGFSSTTRFIAKCANTGTWTKGSFKIISIKGIKLPH